MEIQVRFPGLQTTVQDLGRFGYQSLGVPPAGAMDRDALETANLLVGNARGEACLECILTGPELECHSALVFSVCGAPMNPCVNGKPVPQYETICAEAGDIISLGAAERGLCTYIAFAGGLAIEQVLHSRSTYTRAGFGGWQGRPFLAGDRVPLKGQAMGPNDVTVPIRHVPEESLPLYAPEITVRAILSHEAARFEPESIGRFFSEPFWVSPKSDRMGCRLEGPQLVHNRGADILSAGVQTGTVQVPGDGLPIILLVDHQTTGGYTRIAHVIQADLAKLGQARPGDTIRFGETTVEAAQAAWKKREKRIVGLVQKKTYPPHNGSDAEAPVGEKRYFNVFVNGSVYDVTVQEIGTRYF